MFRKNAASSPRPLPAPAPAGARGRRRPCPVPDCRVMGHHQTAHSSPWRRARCLMPPRFCERLDGLLRTCKTELWHEGGAVGPGPVPWHSGSSRREARQRGAQSPWTGSWGPWLLDVGGGYKFGTLICVLFYKKKKKRLSTCFLFPQPLAARCVWLRITCSWPTCEGRIGCALYTGSAHCYLRHCS